MQVQPSPPTYFLSGALKLYKDPLQERLAAAEAQLAELRAKARMGTVCTSVLYENNKLSSLKECKVSRTFGWVNRGEVLEYWKMLRTSTFVWEACDVHHPACQTMFHVVFIEIHSKMSKSRQMILLHSCSSKWCTAEH